jgi:sugar/nucleoside kinase (ribokinase family)
MPTVLCVGEPIVDLIAQTPSGSGDGPRYTPHLGGTAANIAVVAARVGARVALAGAIGDDRLGGWLREQLAAEGVDVSRCLTRDGVASAQVVVSFDVGGEPAYEPRGEITEALPPALGDDVDRLLDGVSGVLLTSNTLAGADERALTMRIRERALAGGRPVLLDCDLRAHRWSSRTDAIATVNACVPDALLVRANWEEAAMLTGEDDPQRAATALRKAGAGVVVITLGGDGALLRGASGVRVDARAPAVDVISPIGAGDALTGTLVAALERSGYYPDAAAAALQDAVAAAAQACTHWGAVD